MEPPPGTKDEPQESRGGLMDSVGRFVGFLLFAAPAMLIVAALVLLPMYKHRAQTEYGLACLQTKVDEAKQYIEGNRRLIHDLPDDEVLNVRLVMSQTPLTPANETVVYDPDIPPRPPTMVNATRLPLPPPPRGRLIQLANRLENPTTKRGLILVAIGSMLAALFLFSPPAPKKQ